MVKLTFNAYGFAFQKGATQLIDAYRLASQALEANYSQVAADLVAYEASVAAGQPVIGEWDDDGLPLWTQDQLLGLQVEDSADALRALRRSFVVALYHHWERWTRRQFKTDNGNHESLVSLAARHGMPIHPGLAGVRDLANLLKHSNRKRGLDLLNSWPNLLPPHFTPGTQADWYEAVRLDDEAVYEVAEIVKASGPHSDEIYADLTAL